MPDVTVSSNVRNYKYGDNDDGDDGEGDNNDDNEMRVYVLSYNVDKYLVHNVLAFQVRVTVHHSNVHHHTPRASPAAHHHGPCVACYQIHCCCCSALDPSKLLVVLQQLMLESVTLFHVTIVTIDTDDIPCVGVSSIIQ